MAFVFRAQPKNSRGCEVFFSVASLILHTFMKQYIRGPGAGCMQPGVSAAQGAMSSPPRAT